MNYQQLQYTPPERQMRSKSPHHLISTVSDSSKPSKKHFYSLNVSQLEFTPSPNASPGPRPIIRPIPSPMTPITPLVLTESLYQKEFLQSSISNSHDPNEYGYFYHGNNIQSPLSQLSHRYGYHNQYGYSINHPTQLSAPFAPSTPSPLSSGASTPTYSACLESSFSNQLTILNNYCDEGSFQPNAVNADDDEDALCHVNTHFAHPSGFVNFDSEDGGDMFKDLIITNPLDASLYYQNPHLQKSQYEIVVNEIGKCQEVVHSMSHCVDAHGDDRRNDGVHNVGDVGHPMLIDSVNFNETMVNHGRTSSQNNDIQFHEILKGMNNMDIADFY